MSDWTNDGAKWNGIGQDGSAVPCLVARWMRTKNTQSIQSYRMSLRAKAWILTKTTFCGLQRRVLEVVSLEWRYVHCSPDIGSPDMWSTRIYCQNTSVIPNRFLYNKIGLPTVHIWRTKPLPIVYPVMVDEDNIYLPINLFEKIFLCSGCGCMIQC